MIETFMFKPISKLLIVTAMLFAFIGQALAYASMACEMTTEYESSQMSFTHEDMSHHEMMGHEIAQNQPMQDCCDADCTCPAKACSPVSVILESTMINDGFAAVYQIFPLIIEWPKPISSSLYRPPIFA